jgi:hypothetical protein
VTISAALTASTWVDMNVGYDGQLRLPAYLPDHAELSSIELNDSVRETGRIDVIVVKEPANFSYSAVYGPKKKRATLAITARAAS